MCNLLTKNINDKAKKICVWGYMLKKIGLVEGRLFFNFLFVIISFSIQRAYGKLKQNLVKFTYTQLIN